MADNRARSVRRVLAGREREEGSGAAVRRSAHWELTKGQDGIAWLILDRAEESAKSLSEQVLRELDQMLTDAEGLDARGLVLRSAKAGGFAAGADLRDFRGVTGRDEIAARMTEAHRIVDRLAGFRLPTVALVHGHCLGGGLELALACDHLIAIHGARLGFPEVLLGLHPGLGGTFRLPVRIAPLAAMRMMLTGRTVHAARAKRLGLVDAVVEERHAAAAVRAAIGGDRNHRGRGWRHALFALRPARRLAAGRMRGQTEEKAPSRHYPAPHRLIGLWEEHGGDPVAMQKAEIASFAGLLAGTTAQNLIRVFFLREKLKAFGKGDSGVARVHVVGAGRMGGDIAAWCAARGLTVTLSDLEPEALAKAVGRAADFFERKLHAPLARRDALDRLVPDPAGDGVRRADLVLEAVAEDAETKRKVFAGLAPRMKQGAILASNTSSIALEALRADLPHPERLVGLHFFNPVAKMELVEVVAHDQAAPDALARARAFCGDIDRLPAPVADSPGFLVNRALTAYLVEAFLMLDEGVAKEAVDRAARDFGMPMGPVELADQVGLDIGLHVAESLQQAFPEEVPDIPDWLRKKVEKGELGRKSGKGLYRYDGDGKPVRGRAPAPGPEMADRLVLPMINTCIRLLREAVVEEADTLDAAMIFGTGFAPFRGGPVHYARSRGGEEIVAALKRLEEKHGARFRADEGWQRLHEY